MTRTRRLVNRVALAAIAGALWSPLAAAPALTAPSADESAIRRIEDGMTGEQSAQAITAHWSKDVVWFDMLSGNVTGLEAVRSDLGTQIARLTNIHIQIKSIDIHADNAVGFAFSTQRITGDGRNGAPGITIDYRQTDGFVKVGGKWTLVHQHLSVPFDPATGKAILTAR
jgi:ketosteroid isomerase-like protein